MIRWLASPQRCSWVRLPPKIGQALPRERHLAQDPILAFPTESASARCARGIGTCWRTQPLRVPAVRTHKSDVLRPAKVPELIPVRGTHPSRAAQNDPKTCKCGLDFVTIGVRRRRRRQGPARARVALWVLLCSFVEQVMGSKDGSGEIY